MASTLESPPPTARVRMPAPSPRPIPASAAWLMALGSFLSLAGFAWDVQWHTDVGPDTFFTLPHLLIYSGSALVGLVCLVMSLRILRSARTAGEGLSLSPVPRAFLISGFGTVIFLACGLWDEWWHSIYGFDVTIMSPPHIGLLTSVEIGLIGTLVAFASTSYGANRFDSATWSSGRVTVSATLGFAFVAASAGSFALFFGEVASAIPLDLIGVEAYLAYLTTTLVIAMMVTAAATRARFAATLVAASGIALTFVFDGLTIAATDWYADALGLFIRDESLAVERLSEFTNVMPFWAALLGAGVIIDALIFIGNRYGLSGRAIVPIAGALAACCLGVLYRIGLPYAEAAGILFPTIPTVVALLALGAVSAMISWQLGNIARVTR